MSKRAEDFLEDAAAVLRERAKARDAGDGERSMSTAVDIFRQVSHRRMGEHDGWLFMICLKLARSSQGDYHADDYLDIIGYAALLAECKAKYND